MQVGGEAVCGEEALQLWCKFFEAQTSLLGPQPVQAILNDLRASGPTDNGVLSAVQCSEDQLGGDGCLGMGGDFDGLVGLERVDHRDP